MRPSVAPYLTVSPALAAIAYYTTVFGAQQKTIMPAFDGLRIMHCELLINGGSVMLADAFPELGYTRMALPGELVTSSISLEYVTGKEVDEVFAKVQEHFASPRPEQTLTPGYDDEDFRAVFGG